MKIWKLAGMTFFLPGLFRLGSHMFSADGKLVYGIRSDGKRNMLFSVDIATGVEKVLGDLGKDFSPSTNLRPGIRFSLAPDGKSFVYSIVKSKSNLWMLEGFEPKPGLLARLARKFNISR